MKKGNVKKTIPIEGNCATISPEKFKHNTLSLFREERKHLKGLPLSHYKIRLETTTNTSDGIFQFAGTIISDILACHCTPVFFECKRIESPVKRNQIWALKEEMKNRKAEKGIFVTTSYYQFGAVKYAKEHNILLLSILSEETQYIIQNKRIKEASHLLVNPVITIKPFSVVRVWLKNDTEASVSYFEKGDFWRFFFAMLPEYWTT